MILLRSTFLLTVLFVIIMDFSLSVFQPLRYFDVTEFIPLEQNPLVMKLRTFLDKQHENPEVLMLGSSLFLFPSTRTDEAMEGKAPRYDQWYVRHRVSADTVPRYFTKELESVLHRPISVCNLGVQGSIVSDQLLILQKALACGKTPKIVILEIAPRSFQDNMHKVIRSTPVYQVLGDFSSAPPLFAQGHLNKQALVALPGLVSYFYKVKADYRSLVANIVAAALNRPMNSWESREGIRRNKLVTVVNPEMEWQASEKPLFPKYHDLQMYKQVYNPPDPNFCAAEQGDCLKLLDLAKSANIEVIIVDMPLTSRNQLLIDRLYVEKYKKFVDYLEKKRNVKVVRLFNDPYITDEDFEDSAHMNASGGRKLFSRLCAAILSEVNRGEIVLSR